MKNILILGASGFLGEKIFHNLKKNKNNNILTLDKKKFSISKKHLQKKIQNINLDYYLKKYNISLVIDCIGSPSHDFSSTKKIKKNLNENFINKIKIINDIEKYEKKFLYVTFGTLYKYGKKKKINKIYRKPLLLSEDIQAIGKYMFELYLFHLQNKNISTLVINLGSIYGNKYNSINFIDKIIYAIKNKIKFKVYINNFRLKNIYHIDQAIIQIINLINETNKKKKFSYQEYNLIGNLFNFKKLKAFSNIKFIRSKSNNLNNYYYINKKKFNNFL